MKKYEYRNIQIIKRFKKIGHSFLIGSGKGGVGKSVIAATISLILSKMGYKTGLLDLDIHGGTIGWLARGVSFKESKSGLLPPIIKGVKVMSLTFLSSERPLPLRGGAKSEAITEILAITNWGDLDYLVVDLPPGTGDEMLTALRLIPDPKSFIIVTIPSQTSKVVVEKLILLLKEIGIKIDGIIENMAWLEHEGNKLKIFGDGAAGELAQKHGIRLLGLLPIDPKLNAYQNLETISSTKFASEIKRIVEDLISTNY